MGNEETKATHDRVDSLYRTESSRVLATLIRLLGDFDLADEAVHDAFAAAMEQWPRDGVPDNPRGSYQPGASRRLMPFGDAPASTHR